MLKSKLTLILFQITVAKTHPVKQKGLKDVIKKFKNSFKGFEILLVFLTPPSVFGEWKSPQKVEIWDSAEEAKSEVCKQAVWCMQTRDRRALWS